MPFDYFSFCLLSVVHTWNNLAMLLLQDLEDAHPEDELPWASVDDVPEDQEL